MDAPKNSSKGWLLTNTYTPKPTSITRVFVDVSNIWLGAQNYHYHEEKAKEFEWQGPFAVRIVWTRLLSLSLGLPPAETTEVFACGSIVIDLNDAPSQRNIDDAEFKRRFESINNKQELVDRTCLQPNVCSPSIQNALARMCFLTDKEDKKPMQTFMRPPRGEEERKRKVCGHPARPSCHGPERSASIKA